jgi:hypothetical protein
LQGIRGVHSDEDHLITEWHNVLRTFLSSFDYKTARACRKHFLHEARCAEGFPKFQKPICCEGVPSVWNTLIISKLDNRPQQE